VKICEFDQLKMSESAERIKAGRTPLPRLFAPSLYSDPSHSIYVGTRGNKLVVLDPTTSSAGSELSGAEMVHVLHKTPESLCFFDQPTLSLALREIEAENHHVARSVDYLAKQPGISKVAVLTRLLSLKWWIPPTKNATVSLFAEMFGVNDSSLVTLARTGTPTNMPKVQLRSTGNQATDAVFLWKGRQSEAYLALEALSGLWQAVCDSDPILYERGLARGTTARLTPVRYDGHKIRAEVSLPFKLREGKSILVFGPGIEEAGTLKFESLSLGSDSGRLMADLTRGASRGAHAHLFDDIGRSIGTGRHFYAISEPFAGSSAQRAGMSVTPKKPIVRDVPLDVALGSQ
jgi:hypothetical protein